MARWENEDVSDLNLPDPQKVDKEYFGKSAASVDKKEAFAYMATVDKSNSYYILYDRAEIIDAYNDRLPDRLLVLEDLRRFQKTVLTFTWNIWRQEIVCILQELED